MYDWRFSCFSLLPASRYELFAECYHTVYATLVFWLFTCLVFLWRSFSTGDAVWWACSLGISRGTVPVATVAVVRNWHEVVHLRCIVDCVGLFTELLDWVTWERKKIERRVQHCPTLQLKLFQHVPTCFKMFPFHVWPDAWTAASSGELAGGKRLWTLWAAWIAWMAWIAWRRAREMAWPWHDLRHLATEHTQTKWH